MMLLELKEEDVRAFFSEVLSELHIQHAGSMTTEEKHEMIQANRQFLRGAQSFYTLMLSDEIKEDLETIARDMALVSVLFEKAFHYLEELEMQLNAAER